MELRAALKRNKLANRESLTDLELCSVAIAYNKGSFDPQRGLKQGHFDGERFYGEHIFDFLRLAQSAPLAGVPAPLATPPPAPPPCRRRRRSRPQAPSSRSMCVTRRSACAARR